MNRFKHKHFKIDSRQMDEIKIEGLEQFIKYVSKKSLFGRIVFALKIIFKALKL